MRSFFSLLSLLFFALNSSAVSAENSAESSSNAGNERIVIAFFEYPPLAHLTHSGRVSGQVIETVREICIHAGLDCELRILPVARVYRSVFNGSASVIITGRHPNFGDCCKVTNWQFPWTAGIYSRQPSEMIAVTEEELKSHKMIVVRGWRSPYRYFENLEELTKDGVIKLALAQDNISAIRMLEHERAEYMWGGSHFGWYLEKSGLTGQFNYKPLISSPLALWVDKNRPDIRLALNKGYERLLEKGMLNADGSRLRDSLMKTRYEDAAQY